MGDQNSIDQRKNSSDFYFNHLYEQLSSTIICFNMALASARGKLIGVIGDEDTCVGFLLGGIGEMNKNRQPNFLVVNNETPMTDIEDCLKSFIKRDDIDIILINQSVAEMVRHVIDAHTSPVPAILEIPSKDHPYDPSKDSILRRAKGLFNPDDMG